MWQEINRELDVLNEEKERLSRQTTDDDAEREQDQKVPFPLLAYLDKHELTNIDNRDEDGALWVVGDWSLREFLFPLKDQKIYFDYAPKGVNINQYQQAWILLTKEIPLVPEEE